MSLSFGSTLLGKPSHKAVLKLQEYELSLLEVMKRTLSARIKCDKEYAQNLAQLVVQGAKISSPRHDSPVFQAWIELLQHMSQVGTSLKRNAETFYSTTLQKLNKLTKDKAVIKKFYEESRNQLDNELLKVMHKELDRKYTSYSKMEMEAERAYQSFEQALSQAGSSNFLNKLNMVDRAQEKYRKTTMKLHNYHNDYVLQVEEAQMHQQHYRLSLLPELLNGIQHMEYQYLDTLKEVMSEYLQFSSPTKEEVIACHKEASEKVKTLDFNSEYRGFLDSNQSDLEREASISFLPLSGRGSLLPCGQPVLNNLTIQQLEHMYEEYTEDLHAIQQQIDQHKANVTDLHKEIDRLLRSDDSTILTKKHQEVVSAKFALINCENQQIRLKQLRSVVHGPLRELGDKDPPSALALPEELDPAALQSSSFGSDQSTFPFNVGKTISTLKTKLTGKNKTVEAKRQPVFDSSKPYTEQLWYHGNVTSAEVGLLLVNEGDFLVRESKNTPGQAVLSARWNATILHFKVQTSDTGGYRFEKDLFSSVFELVHQHFKSRIPISKKTNCTLAQPICKDKWRLTHDDILIGDELGSGNFGTVYMGVLKKNNEYVAVKTSKEAVDTCTMQKFLLEAEILKGYDHPNIVKLIGVCMDRHPIYIVMELVRGGDLRKYLKDNTGQLNQYELVRLCKDACAGLAYLEEKKCIHRDVAARNCLITEDVVVKITDFGMSREEPDGVYSMRGNAKQIPIRWTAPEAIEYQTYTTASDVWSFGILSWEVFSFADKPYPGLTNSQIREQLAGGYRMPKQGNCPDKYYNNVMLPAWNEDWRKRPRFSDLCSVIETILKKL